MEKFVAYGQFTYDFKIFANLKKYLKKIKLNEIEEHRVDCYPIDYLSTNTKKTIFDFLKINCNISSPNMEAFYPSDNYPSHFDSGEISYFIPLESGLFTINNIQYPVLPFVVYSFNEGHLHNTNFCSLMIK